MAVLLCYLEYIHDNSILIFVYFRPPNGQWMD